MTETFPRLFQINIPFLVILALFLLAGLAAWWQYRQRFATDGLAVILLLTVLRSLVIFAVLLFIFAPVLKIISPHKQTAEIALYVDNSASMTENRLDSTRWERTKKIIRRIPQLTGKNVRLNWFVFNQSVKAVVPDSIFPSSLGTSYSALLGYINKNKKNKSIILSDGLDTDTELELDVFRTDIGQVFTIGIGKKDDSGDIYIEDVVYRPLIYAGKAQKVKIRVRGSYLKENQNKVITLYAGQKRIGRKQVTISADGSLQEVGFAYTIKEPGMVRFKAELETLPNEINKRNNRSFFVQRVLKTRLQIALFAAHPGYESKFLRLLIQNNPDFDVHYFVEKAPGRFFNNQHFDPGMTYDLIIFVDFPGQRTSQALLEQIHSYLQRGSSGLLTFLGRRIRMDRLQLFEQWLPFKKMPRAGRDIEATVIPLKEQNHPLLNVFDSFETTQRFWNMVPPVFVSLQGYQLKEKAEPLLETQIENRQNALFVLYERHGTRNGVFIGEGYWQWHFLLQRDALLKKGYDRFLTQLIRWLSDRIGKQTVVIQIGKSVAHPGEKIEMKIILNDAAFQPVSDGDVTLEVRSGGQSFEIETRRDSSGVFHAEFQPPQEGRFRINAKGYRNGQFLGEAKAQLEVVPLNKEFLRLGQDTRFLKKIAGYNNGFYISERGIDSLKSVLVNENPVINKEKRFELWYSPWFFIVILLLLTTEWVIRKKIGLV